ncbi:hypothetical protein [Abyssalbus ytuae]|uniref:Tetratricopeptide repeat protein n=1 Tax=Abyssalbus ytuae TaxID=2926907 RepID=A0A9E7D2Z1_9FLAO|nr:hypothetical protein [Abyssalbus ytuae]UOB18698.1 hypothetical protein MQE35_05255 [Abyssalbus ytuae]
MNVADFTYLLTKPNKVTKENIESVEKIIEEFPFFQPAKAIYLKALKDQDSFKYNAFLKQTAAFTTDRSILFELITSKSFSQNKIAEKITKQISEVYNIEVKSEEIVTETPEEISITPNKEQHLNEVKQLIESENRKEEKTAIQAVTQKTTIEITPPEKDIPEEKETIEQTIDPEAKLQAESEEYVQNILEDEIQNKVDPEIKEPDKKQKELPKTSFDFDNVDSEAVMDPELFLPKPTIRNYSFLKLDKKEKIKDKKVEEQKEVVIPIPKTEESKEIKTTPEEELQIGKPLEFDNTETHSFTEWLKLSHAKPIERENTESQNIQASETGQEQNKQVEKKKENVQSSLQEKFDLIDKFIETNPKIIPVSGSTPQYNLAKERVVEKTELMTETLARVYLEQKKYKKAIQAYKILSLKYPEKSSFFADQINAVKKLQQNN